MSTWRSVWGQSACFLSDAQTATFTDAKSLKPFGGCCSLVVLWTHMFSRGEHPVKGNVWCVLLRCVFQAEESSCRWSEKRGFRAQLNISARHVGFERLSTKSLERAEEWRSHVCQDHTKAKLLKEKHVRQVCHWIRRDIRLPQGLWHVSRFCTLPRASPIHPSPSYIHKSRAPLVPN